MVSTVDRQKGLLEQWLQVKYYVFSCCFSNDFLGSTTVAS